eukprot:gene9156-1647_t
MSSLAFREDDAKPELAKLDGPPTHFIAMRVDDPAIVEKMVSVQEALCSAVPGGCHQELLIPPARFHVTLQALEVRHPGHLLLIKQALKDFAPGPCPGPCTHNSFTVLSIRGLSAYHHFSSCLPNNSTPLMSNFFAGNPSMSFSGLGNFDDQVLYAAVDRIMQPGDSAFIGNWYRMQAQLDSAIRQMFRNEAEVDIRRGARAGVHKFHCTLAKTPAGHQGQLPGTWDWSSLGDITFGKQAFTTLELLRMHSTDADGFWVSEYSVPFIPAPPPEQFDEEEDIDDSGDEDDGAMERRRRHFTASTRRQKKMHGIERASPDL